MGFQNGWRGPDIVSDGLVLYLDAGSPNSYRTDFGTTWKDMSGTGYIGTFINAPTYSPTNGGSLVFDGVDDYVNIPNSTTFSNFTAEVIINPASNPGNIAAAISTEYPGSNLTVNFAIGFENNQFFGGFYNFSAGGWNRIYTTIPTLNVYSHYVLTYNGAQMIFYKNSTSVGILNTTNIAAGGNPIRIGRRWDLAEYFPGKIDVARVYNRALSSTEVQQNYNAQKSRFGL